jgi:murein L,D-transpeptidase YcbB/YkuD
MRSRESIITKDGRNSIIKSSQSTTIYFGDELKEEEKAPNHQNKKAEEISTKDNKKKWNQLWDKMSDILQKTEQEEEAKQEQEAASFEDREVFRHQLNSVLKKAQKLHELKRTDSSENNKTEKVVILRPEAKNWSKSISLVRIRDISHVKFQLTL